MLEVGNVTIQALPMVVCHVKEMELSRDTVMTDLVQLVRSSDVRDSHLFSTNINKKISISLFEVIDKLILLF